MKLIIAGSRGITDYEVLKLAIVKSGLWKKYGQEIEVVSGMAATGADALGVSFATRNNLTLHKYPADWSTYGKAAGHIRNAQMADHADVLLALWDGESPGTKNMIDTARKKGLEVHAYKAIKAWTIWETD